MSEDNSPIRERPLSTGGGGLKIWAKMTSRI